MKDKILLFVIGVLVGAIISTGSFFVYTKLSTTSNTNNNQMVAQGGNPPSMQDGQMGEPPAKPGENSTQNSSQTNSN